jgi:hypothetical protein
MSLTITESIIASESSSNSERYKSSNNSLNSPSSENSSIQNTNLVQPVYIMPLREFQKLKDPLDIIEHLYSSQSSALEYYGINDLNSDPPFNYFDASQKELIIKASSICLVKVSFYVTIIKMILFPHIFLVDICGCVNIKRLHKEYIDNYSYLLFFFMLARIAVVFCLFILGTTATIVLGIWILLGLIMEFVQFFIVCCMHSDIIKMSDEELEIVKYESFKCFDL